MSYRLSSTLAHESCRSYCLYAFLLNLCIKLIIHIALMSIQALNVLLLSAFIKRNFSTYQYIFHIATAFKLLQTPWLCKLSTTTSACDHSSLPNSSGPSQNSFRATALANPLPRYGSWPLVSCKLGEWSCESPHLAMQTC